MTDINPNYDIIKEPLSLTGTCYCTNLKYLLRLEDKKDAKTMLCHCKSCKKAFGGAFGLTAKVPIRAFRYAPASGKPTVLFQKTSMIERIKTDTDNKNYIDPCWE